MDSGLRENLYQARPRFSRLLLRRSSWICWTVKADDVEGRAKVYEAIVKGQVPEEPGLPESFNVLVRELQALALDVELLQQADE